LNGFAIVDESVTGWSTHVLNNPYAPYKYYDVEDDGKLNTLKKLKMPDNVFEIFNVNNVTKVLYPISESQLLYSCIYTYDYYNQVATKDFIFVSDKEKHYYSYKCK